MNVRQQGSEAFGDIVARGLAVGVRQSWEPQVDPESASAPQDAQLPSDNVGNLV